MRHSGGLVGIIVIGGGAVVPAAGQATHDVDLVGIEFLPPDITISLGDTVRWNWVSGFHNVESGEVIGGSGIHDGRFRSGNPTSVAGTTYELTFDRSFLDSNPAAGNVYPYYCVVHGGLGMVGAIAVLLPGDVDGDGGVTLLDHSLLSACTSGPGKDSANEACTPEAFAASDADGDGDVDLRDFAVIQRSFSG